MPAKPLILWFRRDLRLADHPMLTAAVAGGRPLIPVFVLDDETQGIGAAPKWRLGLALAAFDRALQALGGRLILRSGPALAVLQDLVAETGAAGVMWTRAYDAGAKARDTGVKTALRAQGQLSESHPGHLLHEPWTVATGQGGAYQVYTPFWNAVGRRPVPEPKPAPGQLRWPAQWPRSDALPDWHLGRAMQRGGAVVLPHQTVGEAAAQARLARFLAGPVADYASQRDDLGRDATSGLSENLTYGEIGIRQVWHAGWHALHQGAAGAERFLKELVWREFAWHLMYHFPDLASRSWRRDWDGFCWRGDTADAEAWRRGMTGEPVVDAAMREMFVTGRMHNRARMITASYLTKHLLTDWRVGLDWFAQCLTDWDPAANAMGWQWVAGSGPDAAPYFRIFNPAKQAETWDRDGIYRRRWLAEAQITPPQTALDYFAAVPRTWALDPKNPAASPIIDLNWGRQRALAAYQQRNT